MNILNVYFVFDTSGSMKNINPITNEVAIKLAPEVLRSLRKELNKEVLVDQLRFNVITFNTDVHSLLRNGTFEEFKRWVDNDLACQLAENACTGLTKFGKMFAHLNSCIEQDITSLANQDNHFRPLVYLVSDGKPEGEDANYVQQQYRKMVGHTGTKERWNPVVLCIALGDEKKYHLIKRYGAGRVGSKGGAYRYDNWRMAFGTKKGGNLRRGLETLNESVIKSIRSSLVQGETIVMPELDGEENIFIRRARLDLKMGADEEIQTRRH